MKCVVLVGGAVLALSSIVQAAQVPPAPVPDPHGSVGAPIVGTPIVGAPVVGGPAIGTAMPVGTPVTLFDCVRYKDARNIAPCAVPMIVSVPDPCACRDACNACCEQKCVYVQICVPPCGCSEVKWKRHGDRLVYDFGKYEVEITSRRGVVVVDYDD